MPVARRLLSLFVLFALTPLLAGCPSSNVYGTPRTVPPGEIFHTVAVEAFRASGSYTQLTTRQTTDEPPRLVVENGPRDETLFTPTLPTYVVRYGLTSSVDVGFRAANLSSPLVDLKWNFVKNEGFDMAVDPGVQYAPISSTIDVDSAGKPTLKTIHTVHFHTPLILGINFNDTTSLVVTPGLVTTLTSHSRPVIAREALQTTPGLAARFGVGVNLRLAEYFVLQPEISGVRWLDESGLMWLTFGVAVGFGAAPRYRANPLLDP